MIYGNFFKWVIRLKRILKDSVLDIVNSLIANFLWNYTTISLKMETFYIFDSKYLFFISWLIFLLTIILLRRFIRKKIDKKQEPYPVAFSIPYNSDFHGEARYKGFLWKLSGNMNSSQRMRRDLFENEWNSQEVDITSVGGPFCIYDYRTMTEQRTYFGLFKYICPKCGYKKKLLKNSWTLKCELKDEIESQQRMKNGKYIYSDN